MEIKKTKGLTFIDEIEEEKFIDFLNLTKDEFLVMYRYLTSEDYDLTVIDYIKYVKNKFKDYDKW